MAKVRLNELVDMAKAWNDQLVDAISPTSNMSLKAGEEEQILSFAQVAPNGDLAEELFGAAPLGQGTMTEGAFFQLCQRLNVPPSWAEDNEKCPPELREYIANWKLARAEATLMVRQRDRGETVRGILSSQYKPYNHLQLVEAVDAALKHEGLDVEVILKHLDDDLRAYLILPQINFDAPDGNGGRGRSADGGGTGGITPAVYIGNSEIGNGKVRINPGGFRSYCTNGVIYGWRNREQDAFSIIHRWHTITEMAVLVNEGIVKALAMSEEGATKFIEAQTVTLKTEKVGDLVEAWARKYGIAVGTKEKLEAMTAVRVSDVGRYTLFDFINDTTQVARDLENPAQAETLEIMAGDLVYQGVGASYREG